MLQRAQHAYSKNHTLQKQLEDKYLDLRRSFKHSRRRHDTVEEECLSSLYKLLLYTKEKQEEGGEDQAGDEEHLPKRPNSVFEKPKSPVRGKQRPKTALSAKTYTQSYSFTADGMNIQKTIRDRYMRSKKEKEMTKNPFFKIERLEKRRPSEQNPEDRPMTTVPTTDENEFPEPTPRRPKTALPGGSGNHTSLSRPQVTITLPSNDESHVQSSTTIHKMNAAPLDAILNYNTENGNLRHMVKSIYGQGRMSTHPNDIVSRPSSRQSVAQGTDAVDGERERSQTRAESRISNIGEDDLIPLNATEQHELDRLCVKETEYRRSPSSCSSRTGFNRAPSRITSTRATSTPTDGNILKNTSDKTQSFLTQYSKKSKLFGYVVKTRASPLTPRDRVMSFRSPYITYQELASIKAGIKQQVSSTRSLVQRSAKLSTYVDKLATGSLLRKHLQDLKESRSSTN